MPGNVSVKERKPRKSCGLGQRGKACAGLVPLPFFFRQIKRPGRSSAGPKPLEKVICSFTILCRMFVLILVAFLPVTSAFICIFKEQISWNGGCGEAQTYDPVVGKYAGSVDNNREAQVADVNLIVQRNFVSKLHIRLLDPQLDVGDKHHDNRNRI